MAYEKVMNNAGGGEKLNYRKCVRMGGVFRARGIAHRHQRLTRGMSCIVIKGRWKKTHHIARKAIVIDEIAEQ